MRRTGVCAYRALVTTWRNATRGVTATAITTRMRCSSARDVSPYVSGTVSRKHALVCWRSSKSSRYIDDSSLNAGITYAARFMNMATNISGVCGAARGSRGVTPGGDQTCAHRHLGVIFAFLIHVSSSSRLDSTSTSLLTCVNACANAYLFFLNGVRYNAYFATRVIASFANI